MHGTEWAIVGFLKKLAQNVLESNIIASLKKKKIRNSEVLPRLANEFFWGILQKKHSIWFFLIF